MQVTRILHHSVNVEDGLADCVAFYRRLGLPDVPRLINNGVPPGFSEAFRTLRTSVLFSTVDAHTHTIVVTSARPGEGKTVTSSNLAMGIAQAGQRVVLIDTDMRRPRVHEVFDIEQEPGLSSLLVGHAHANEVMHPSGVQNFWVIPAGPTPPAAA